MIGTSSAIALLTAVPIAPEELSTCSSAGERRSSHRAFGGKHRVAASDHLDLTHGLLHALDRGLRPPTEGVAPKPRRERPLVAADLHRSGHSLDRAQSLLASDPIDQSHLVGVHLFGQEELAVMGKLLLAGVARDRGEEMSHAPIPLWPEDPPKPLRLLLARTERSRDWIRPTQRTVWTSACDRRWRCRASIHACMVQFGSPFLHGHLP